MITFKAIVISNNRRKDGTYPVKIRVTYKGVSRRLATAMVCKPADLTRSQKIKNADILSHADKLIVQMREAIKDVSPFDLESKDVDWVVRRIKDRLSGERFSLDFFEWADKFIMQKKPATRKAYSRALNALERFLQCRSLDINAISKMMIIDFMEFVDAEPKMRYDRKTGQIVQSKVQRVPKAASSVMVMKLAHIFDAAKNRFNDEDSDLIRIPKSPFKSIHKVFPVGDQAQEALSKEVIQQIISAQTDDPRIRLALDAFVVSFALMGANLADLYHARPFPGSVWCYNRMKITSRKAEMRVDIPAEIIPYIYRLQNEGDYWLSRLHDLGKDKDVCGHGINLYLRKWQSKVKLADFTFYAARHSWATIARSLGVDLAAVNECLCHKDNLEIGRRYAPLTWEEKNEINRRVIDSFVWK